MYGPKKKKRIKRRETLANRRSPPRIKTRHTGSKEERSSVLFSKIDRKDWSLFRIIIHLRI